MAGLFAEYQAFGPAFMDSLTFRDYLQVQYGIRSRDHHQGHRHHRAASRFHLPTFDGSSNSSAKSWVEKLDIYFQFNPMLQSEAIKVATLHLDGEA